MYISDICKKLIKDCYSAIRSYDEPKFNSVCVWFMLSLNTIYLHVLKIINVVGIFSKFFNSFFY